MVLMHNFLNKLCNKHLYNSKSTTDPILISTVTNKYLLSRIFTKRAIHYLVHDTNPVSGTSVN